MSENQLVSEKNKHGHEHTVNVKKTEHLSPTQIKLTIEIPYEEVNQHEAQTLKKFSLAAKMPGFRPGKAPLKLVKDRYRDDIHKDVISHLVEAGLYEAISQSKLVPITRPSVNLNGFSFEKSEPLAFDIEFEIQPGIVLRDYKNIKLKAQSAEVSDEEVQKELEVLRNRLAVLEPSDATKPEKGSFAVVDIAYAVGGSDPDKTQTKQYNVELGNGQVLTELDAALMGLAVGEEALVNAKFPDDYHDKELAGKSATYFCRLAELKKKIMPELNDAFASQLRPGASLEQVKKEIREHILSSKKAEGERLQRQAILEHLVKHNPFDVANVLVEQQMGRTARWIEEDYKRRGLPAIQWNEEDTKSLRGRAEHVVRGSMLLKEVAIKENISLNESTFETRVVEMSKELNRSVDDTRKWLTDRGMLEQLKDEVITDQVYEFLVQNAGPSTRS